MYLFTILSVFTIHTAFAQSDSIQRPKPQFKLGMNYNSALNYYGRTDSLQSTGFFPMAEFWYQDLYINAAPVFVSNQVQSFDYAGTVTTIGYLHTSSKWITNLYALKPFYKPGSQLVQSALKAQTGLSLSYLNKVANLTMGADLKFSDKIDLGLTAGLDHLIRAPFKNGSVLIIDPSIYAYAGTRNFTNTYYKKKPGFLLLPSGTEKVEENVQSLDMMAYEFSVPLIYVRNKWMALLTPSYIMPQNLLTIDGRPDLTEKGRNMFYATIGLKRTF